MFILRLDAFFSVEIAVFHYISFITKIQVIYHKSFIFFYFSLLFKCSILKGKIYTILSENNSINIKNKQRKKPENIKCTKSESKKQQYAQKNKNANNIVENSFSVRYNYNVVKL